jgi:hypothetical protein
MASELRLIDKASLPFGVALLAIAEKQTPVTAKIGHLPNEPR